jgi:concanavalin A-like lectin/glucanase superfamily protein
MKSVVLFGLCAFSFCVNLAPVAAQDVRDFSWQRPHAKVLPKGDLEWAPEPFVFKAGRSVRYIDFDTGDDDSAGTAKATPWKHHPWDANATGKAKAGDGLHTYVFKRGVVYYGKLLADKRGEQSGEPGNPLRLTVDPDWGKGDAVLSGARAFTSGWQKCKPGDAPAKMPETDKVWYIDLGKSFIPRAIWERRGEEIVRIPIARTPNWKDSDPLDPCAEWPMMQHPIYKKKGMDKWTVWEKGHPSNLENWYICDDKHLTNPDPEFYVGATKWSRWGVMMGIPYRAPRRVTSYSPEFHGIDVCASFPSKGRQRNTRYFLEDLPQFLDSPGEYFHDRDIIVSKRPYPNNGISVQGPRTLKAAHPGRVYLRLPKDRNPNDSIIEMGCREQIIDIRHQHDIVISGLRFRFNNPSRGTPDAPFHPGPVWPPVMADPSCVRLVGTCKDIAVANCRFDHVVTAIAGFTRHSAFRMKFYTGDRDLAKGPFTDVMTDIVVRDNDISHTDGPGVQFVDGPLAGVPTPPEHVSDLVRVDVLRNRFFNIAMRPYGAKQSANPAINLRHILRTEVAGNIINRCNGSGVYVYNAKGGNDLRNRPLIRAIIHHNKVTGSMLSSCDYGGIESWQGGPSYVFNNVSGNAMRHFGFAYYIDGQFKSYTFNNIAWGSSNVLGDALYSHTAFMEVGGFSNKLFNNTAYTFLNGGMRGTSAGGRNAYLGNVYANISQNFMKHRIQPKDAASTAYGANVFHGIAAGKLPVPDPGVVTKALPLRDPARHDYRLAKDSPAIDRGVQFFVPWGLYATVGEWHFCKFPDADKIVVGENFYMTDEHIAREMYQDVPWNSLKTHGVSLESYSKGNLEDWTEGVLNFNGKDTFCILSDKELKGDYERTAKYVTVEEKGRKKIRLQTTRKLKRGDPVPTSMYPGEKRRTLDMGTNNLLVEAYLKTTLAGGAIASKLSERAGYVLDVDNGGRPRLTLKADGASCSRTGSVAITDGKWHHVIAEVDRSKADGIAIYIDGKIANGKLSGTMLPRDASLSNTADFLVGRGPTGRLFAGAMDFLRVCRGTLADAETTIEELHAWQFNGPQLRDFAGREPIGGKRDAGALELTD